MNFKLKPAGGAALRIRGSLGGYKSDGKFVIIIESESDSDRSEPLSH